MELRFTPYSALHDLSQLKAPGGGIFASRGANFQYALFGRDSIRVAEDLLPTDRFIAESVIATLISLQGEVFDSVSEEEPGKIHHEHRRLLFGVSEIPAESRAILEALSEKWGGSADALTYYGSADATSQFVILLAQYLTRYGDSFLQQEFPHKSGYPRTGISAARSALAHIEQKISESDLGLYEFQRMNPNGLPIQTWRDSVSGLLHESGEPLNVAQPVAPLELQAYAAEALRLGASVFSPPEQAERCSKLADHLESAVFVRYWIEDERFFASAIDRDHRGAPRLLRTSHSSPALLLKTSVFDGMTSEEKARYLEPVVTQLASDEFLTEVGLRCRARRFHKILPYADYHGSWAVWPTETYDAVKGLRRQGFPLLAEQIENRIVNAVNRAGRNYELFYVSPSGEVLYNPEEVVRKGRSVPATSLPEPGQAWTASAVLAIKRSRRRGSSRMNENKSSLDKELSERVKSPLLNLSELNSLRGERQPFSLDLEKGRKLERALFSPDS